METVDWRLDRRLEIGDRRLETGYERRESGDGTGDRKQET